MSSAPADLRAAAERVKEWPELQAQAMYAAAPSMEDVLLCADAALLLAEAQETGALRSAFDAMLMLASARKRTGRIEDAAKMEEQAAHVLRLSGGPDA